MNTAPTPAQLQIDFISDIACPWCAVGLNALERALAAMAPGISATITFQPFELNPNMPPEGQDAVEHLSAKYGITPAQIEQNRGHLQQRGAEVGFEFGVRTRVWNTFHAHRLLHWAGLPGQPDGAQRALKHALLHAYQTEGRNPGDFTVLQEVAERVGLDAAEAATVLASDRYATDVREAEAFWQQAGIQAVPAVVINRKHLVSGGQPVAVFEQALRRIASET
jgi:predicted DsbA family dithiol-disulfide isomerase